MTASELAAVCARHRLLHGQSTDGRWWCETPDQNPGVAGYPTAADALCALLKAGYYIRTSVELTITEGERWQAVVRNDGKLTGAYSYESELAAVIALADQLAGVSA